jgi:hypothetical protein
MLDAGINMLTIHASDKTLAELKLKLQPTAA